MKTTLFLLQVLLFCCVVYAGRRSRLRPSSRFKFTDKNEPEAPSDILQTFTDLLFGNFSQVGVGMNVTSSNFSGPFEIDFIQFDIPVLFPAKTFKYFIVIGTTVVLEQVLAIQQIDDLIYIDIYFNLKSPFPRDISEGLFDINDFIGLELDDLVKRCDCTRIYQQTGPLAFTGQWQPCQRSGPSLPLYQSSLDCDSFRIIGLRDLERVDRFPDICPDK